MNLTAVMRRGFVHSFDRILDNVLLVMCRNDDRNRRAEHRCFGGQHVPNRDRVKLPKEHWQKEEHTRADPTQKRPLPHPTDNPKIQPADIDRHRRRDHDGHNQTPNGAALADGAMFDPNAFRHMAAFQKLEGIHCKAEQAGDNRTEMQGKREPGPRMEHHIGQIHNRAD